MLAIAGALRTTLTDLLDIHADILPMELALDDSDMHIPGNAPTPQRDQGEISGHRRCPLPNLHPNTRRIYISF